MYPIGVIDLIGLAVHELAGYVDAEYHLKGRGYSRPNKSQNLDD
jgi:hypothetical protein